MTEPTVLKRHLIENLHLQAEQIAQAEDYALTRNISLQEAIVFLELLDYTELSKCVAAIHGKRYVPILDREPSGAAKAKIPLKLAERFNIFPVKYDLQKNLLVIAVADPEDPRLVRELKNVFLGNLRLALCVASQPEIDKAIEVHYRGKTFSSSQVIHVPQDFTIIGDQETEGENLLSQGRFQAEEKLLLLEPDRARGSAVRSLLRAEGYDKMTWVHSAGEVEHALSKEPCDLLLVNGRLFRPKGPWLDQIGNSVPLPRISYYHIAPMLLGQDYPYEEMSKALISMVSYLVQMKLDHEPDLIQQIVACARYGKLLALRLGLGRRQVDGVVLAAWYSGGSLGAEFLSQVSLPYDLEEICHSRGAGGGKRRVEKSILSLIKHYQSLLHHDRESTGDVQQLRKALQQSRSTPEDVAMIETFLKVIKEEEILGRVGESATARILIVDPKEYPDSPFALRLINEGYRVDTVLKAQDAIRKAVRGEVDLIISEVDLKDAKGLQLCLSIKGSANTASIPFLFLTSDRGEGLQAECLEAGAEDFFLKPPDLDVLTLKIKRLISPKQAQTRTQGVHGSLREMKPADFLQTLSAAEKDVEVRLKRVDARIGIIFVQKGEVVHAQTGELKAEEAFYDLMHWHEGEFEMISCTDFPPRTIHSPLMSLLIEGYRRWDESRNEKP
jgi:DNA-binding response OmpR family regulator